MIGAIARARAAALKAYTDGWNAAGAAYAAATREAERVLGEQLEAVEQQCAEDTPGDCVGCRGSDNPECQGCEQFTGGAR